jgi:cytochrome oxidase Cu insertion factor (SCO1/SenC/PrrC family)
MDVLMWNREPVGGPFALVDHTGTARTDQDFRGKVLLVYFGFTFCPDVCPTDLQQIGLALDRLGPLAAEIQPLFITLDPKRDTTEHLAEYVPSFHKDIVGLSGSATAIRAAADAYKVYYREVAREGGSILPGGGAGGRKRLHDRSLGLPLPDGPRRPIYRFPAPGHLCG